MSTDPRVLNASNVADATVDLPTEVIPGSSFSSALGKAMSSRDAMRLIACSLTGNFKVLPESSGARLPTYAQ